MTQGLWRHNTESSVKLRNPCWVTAKDLKASLELANICSHESPLLLAQQYLGNQRHNWESFFVDWWSKTLNVWEEYSALYNAKRTKFTSINTSWYWGMLDGASWFRILSLLQGLDHLDHWENRFPSLMSRWLSISWSSVELLYCSRTMALRSEANLPQNGFKTKEDTPFPAKALAFTHSCCGITTVQSRCHSYKMCLSWTRNVQKCFLMSWFWSFLIVLFTFPPLPAHYPHLCCSLFKFLPFT